MPNKRNLFGQHYPPDDEQARILARADGTKVWETYGWGTNVSVEGAKGNIPGLLLFDSQGARSAVGSGAFEDVQGTASTTLTIASADSVQISSDSLLDTGANGIDISVIAPDVNGQYMTTIARTDGQNGVTLSDWTPLNEFMDEPFQDQPITGTISGYNPTMQVTNFFTEDNRAPFGNIYLSRLGILAGGIPAPIDQLNVIITGTNIARSSGMVIPNKHAAAMTFNDYASDKDVDFIFSSQTPFGVPFIRQQTGVAVGMAFNMNVTPGFNTHIYTMLRARARTAPADVETTITWWIEPIPE